MRKDSKTGMAGVNHIYSSTKKGKIFMGFKASFQKDGTKWEKAYYFKKHGKKALKRAQLKRKLMEYRASIGQKPMDCAGNIVCTKRGVR